MLLINRQTLKQKYRDEKIFVVPANKLNFIKNGFTPIKHHTKLWGLFDSMGVYMYRYEVEGDSSIKQIIPYILILNEEEDKVFTTKRIKGDERLVGKVSIACGGHIDSEDGNYEVVFRAAVRELFEEVNMNTIKPFEIIGFIRDNDSNDHLGVAIIAHAKGDVSVKEVDTLKGGWKNLTELVNDYGHLENWSKYLIDHLVTNKKFNLSLEKSL